MPLVLCFLPPVANLALKTGNSSGPTSLTGLRRAPPSPANWNYDLGNGGWGNKELETYTNSTSNAHLDGNGFLIVTGISTGDGQYTSARLKSLGLQSFGYGRMETRMKIPITQGSWPAFWMLGDDIVTNGWPACGEIDIMENVGFEPSTVHGTLHGPGFADGVAVAPYSLSSGRFDDDFHVFAVERSAGSISFFVDDTLFETITPANLPPGASWPFDNKTFFFIINLAIGGNWPGNPDQSSVFPLTMYVDYVRVYASATVTAPAKPAPTLLDTLKASSPLRTVSAFLQRNLHPAKQQPLSADDHRVPANVTRPLLHPSLR
eukprot:gnl/Hemi2/22525_TR7512_c0_g1_i1.p1 gnl/Hemi2/22525_TR7512_c0_g1~~gnl/Hemi2/22525_TR7512_c0_g1_i1.p1  ORF type:complete len:320 (+),score=80.46 gnl/Hemi2/22525_TR7512_c0_g1_i1:81-1040(+)